MMVSTDGERSYYFLAGEFFGYPQCCVQEWQNIIRSGGLPGRSALIEFRRGFIPCMKHQKEILAGKFKTEADLITDRICETPFPYGGSVELLKYVKSQNR